MEQRAFCHARFAVNHTDNALDIVQEAMLHFVRKYRNKPEAEWPLLFHTVLQSKIRDAFRRQSVAHRFRDWLGIGSGEDDTNDPIQELADPAGVTPLLCLERAELGARLEQCIKELPLRQQQAFLLRVWEGLDTAATAQAMHCSEGSVKTHYFRAVHTLREQLKEEENDKTP